MTITKRKSVWGIALKDGTLQTGMAVFGKRSEAEDAIAKISHLSDYLEAVELGALNSPENPDGWTLMPIAPTAEMEKAISDGIYNDLHATGIYADLLAAAPKPEK